MATLDQLKFARGYTLGRLKKVQEDTWDLQPEGFSNTIRWNVGHIYVTMEYFIQKAVVGYEPVNVEWASLFAAGTSPINEGSTVPSSEELLEALKEQGKRVALTIDGKLSDSLAEPAKIRDLLIMESVDDVVQFVVWHEGVHAGVIDGINRAINS